MANSSRGRNTQTTWIIGAVIGIVIAVAAIVAISSTGGKETASRPAFGHHAFKLGDHDVACGGCGNQAAAGGTLIRRQRRQRRTGVRVATRR